MTRPTPVAAALARARRGVVGATHPVGLEPRTLVIGREREVGPVAEMLRRPDAPLLRLTGRGRSSLPSPSPRRPPRPSFGVRRRVHGLAREYELRRALAQDVATVAERGGEVVGYAASSGLLGHPVAETTDDPRALIAGARAILGPGSFVPTRNGRAATP